MLNKYKKSKIYKIHEKSLGRDIRIENANAKPFWRL